jgi:hypothetical protein
MSPEQILQLIIGPVGAIVSLCVVMYFLWKLFREEQAENRKNFETVAILGEAIKELTQELKVWREASGR